MYFECKRHGTQAVPSWMRGKPISDHRCMVCWNVECALPPRYHAADLSDFDDATQKTARDFMARTGNLLLLGPTGTGKTHLAAALVHERALHGRLSKYILARDMSDQIIREKTADVFIKADFLILDEVGRQYDTDAERERFFDIVNKRYNEMRPTVFIGNMLPNKFAESVGEAVADRIREDHILMTLEGNSRRAS